MRHTVNIKGGTIIEYAILASLVAIDVATVIGALGAIIVEKFTQVLNVMKGTA